MKKAKAVIGLAALIALVIAFILIFKLASGAINAMRSTDASPDPMFSVPPDPTATIPPEMLEEGEAPEPTDRSYGWEQTEHTPVDKTAEELIEEATAGE